MLKVIFRRLRGIVAFEFGSDICRKCGNPHISSSPKTRYSRWLGLLERTCTRCGYVWYEWPKDAKERFSRSPERTPPA